MKAIVLDGPATLRQIDVPTPEPGAYEVRVRVACAGVCGSDVEVFLNRRESRPLFGYEAIGHEISGVIDAIGSDVTGLEVGDRVTCAGTWGGFADYVITSPVNVLRFSARIPFEDACILEVLPGVAMAAWQTGITRASNVLIVGQGLSGLLLTRYVHLHGCSALAVVDPDEQKLAVARYFGATDTFRGTIATVQEAVQSRFESGFDVAIVAVPASDVIDTIVPLMRTRARIVVYGGLSPNASIDLLAMHHRSVSLMKEGECINGIVDARKIWREALRLVEDGLVPLSRLRTHTLPMADAQRAVMLRAEPTGLTLHVVLRNDWVASEETFAAMTAAEEVS
ncbi:MAG TPA: alcohol dehydrogenase catalytic domain-containing protein [Thermoanaerobaculia bacterium]|jgi:threonine dehydrogenase-like Zn-dependent dehydrogenase